MWHQRRSSRNACPGFCSSYINPVRKASCAERGWPSAWEAMVAQPGEQHSLCPSRSKHYLLPFCSPLAEIFLRTQTSRPLDCYLCWIPLLPHSVTPPKGPHGFPNPAHIFSPVEWKAWLFLKEHQSSRWKMISVHMCPTEVWGWGADKGIRLWLRLELKV